MRPKFSLRFLLIAFTLLAILFGIASRIYIAEKEKVRRHQAALAKLSSLRCMPNGVTAKIPSLYESLVRRCIDPQAYQPAGGFLIPSDEYAPLSPPRAEQALTAMLDLEGVSRIHLDCDRFGLHFARLLAAQQSLIELNIGSREFEAGAIMELGKIRSLQTLQIAGGSGDEVLLMATKLPALTNLWVDLRQASRRGPDHLKKLVTLQSLTMISADSTEPYLKSLASFPGLNELALVDCPLDKPAVEALQHLVHLKHLYVNKGVEAPENFAASISTLREIETVELRSPNVETNLSPAALANCPKLKRLSLPCVILTPRDLIAFRGHRALERLHICGEIPLEEIETFLAATSRCELKIVSPNESPQVGAFLPGGADRRVVTYFRKNGKIVTQVTPPGFGPIGR